MHRRNLALQIATLAAFFTISSSVGRAYSPDFPKSGQIDGYFGYSLAPGNSFSVDTLLHLDNRACGVSVGSLLVSTSGDGHSLGQVSLYADPGIVDTQTLSPLGQLSGDILLKPAVGVTVLCTQLNGLRIVNTGGSPIFIGQVSLNYANPHPAHGAR